MSRKYKEFFVFMLVAILSLAMVFSVAASARVSNLLERSSSRALKTEELVAVLDDLVNSLDALSHNNNASDITQTGDSVSASIEAFEKSARQLEVDSATIESIKRRFEELGTSLTSSVNRRQALKGELFRLRRLESQRISSLMSDWHREAFFLSLFIAIVQLLSFLALSLCILLQRQLQAQRTAAQKTALDLSRLVEFSQESIFSVDLNSRVGSWNPGSERIFGCSSEVAIGSSLKQWIRREKDANLCEKVIRSGDSASLEIEMIRTDGKCFWAAVSIAPFLSGIDHSDSHTIVVSEITEQVNMRIQQADFVASLTHDLKNPIIANSLVLNQLISAEIVSAQDVKKIAQKVVTSNEHMVDMLMAMLDLYKIHAGKFCPNVMPVIVPRLLADCIDCLQQRISLSNLSIELSSRCSSKKYRLDPLIVKKIVMNLLDNALKFAPTESIIRVSAEDKESDLLISVEDSGPGIDESRLADIFSLEAPSQGLRTLGQSTGIGLYLVRQLCVSIGAEINYIRLNSSISRFELRIPNCKMQDFADASVVGHLDYRDDPKVCSIGEIDAR